MEHPAQTRMNALDVARGVAILLMILSHGVKGLLTFEQIPAWGLVPIHLLTKAASSLFILIFGMTLGVVFVPHTQAPGWSRKRNRLIVRGLMVFFWYKVLTVLEMSHLSSGQEILGALQYRSFPVFVEILGFYALALLWIPWVLPLWRTSPDWLKLQLPVYFAAVALLLNRFVDFGGHEILKAVLIEHDDFYTWGQLSRAPLVLGGLLLGEKMRESLAGSMHPSRVLVGWSNHFGVVSAGLLLVFLITASPDPYTALVSVAKNEGKHPTELGFMLFSVGAAIGILSVAFRSGSRPNRMLQPLVLMGRNALSAFIGHIFILFVFYRFLLGYWHQITYAHALFLTVLMMALITLGMKVLNWIRENSSA